MKTSCWFVLVALLFAAGCGDSDERQQPEPFDGFVQLSMECDTAVFLPGDTVAVPGNVVVTDRNHSQVAGIRVNVSVTPANMGAIVYPNTVLQDTTNEAGRVDFSLRSSGPEGDAVITVSVGGVSDSCAIHLDKSGPSDSTLFTHVSPTQL